MRLCATALIWLMVAPLSVGRADGGAVPVDRFQAGQAGLVSFPTRDVDGLDDLYTGGQGYDARSLGTLVLPSEAGAARPVPAMVILHGSGGEWSGRGQRHAAFLADQGIAAFVVDTFEARGLGRGWRYLDRLRRANVPDQLTDAFAALDILATHPDIDARRIGVMGYSMGGISAFLAAYGEIAGAAGPTPHRFALHVPFYAPCFVSLTDNRTTGAPIVTLWGERDESTHRAACDAWVREAQDGGSPVTAHWLAGAAHGWNTLSAMTFHPSLPQGSPCRFVVGPGGAVVEQVTGRTEATDEAFIDILASCSGRGYTIGHHAEADAAANAILLDTIAEHLRAEHPR